MSTVSSSARPPDHFTVLESPGLCTLLLPDFLDSDGGTYRTIFPANLPDNTDVLLEVQKPRSSRNIALVLVVIFFLSAAAILVLFYRRFLWSGRKGGEEARRRRDGLALEALRRGRSEEFREAVAGRKLRRLSDSEGNTIFHVAAGSDYSIAMNHLVLSQHPGEELGDLEDPSRTPSRQEIFRVVEISNWRDFVPGFVPEKLVPKILDQKVIDLNTVNLRGETPLHIACEVEDEEYVPEHVELVKFMVENKVRRSLRNNEGNTALHIAVKKKHLGIVKYLLPLNGESNDHLLKQKGSNNATALQLAVNLGFLNIASYIIKDLEDSSWRTYETALVYSAVAGGNNKMLELLKNNGANVSSDLTLENSESFLQRAVREKNAVAVNFIFNTPELKPTGAVFIDDALKIARTMSKSPITDTDKEVVRSIIEILERQQVNEVQIKEKSNANGTKSKHKSKGVKQKIKERVKSTVAFLAKTTDSNVLLVKSTAFDNQAFDNQEDLDAQAPNTLSLQGSPSTSKSDGVTDDTLEKGPKHKKDKSKENKTKKNSNHTLEDNSISTKVEDQDTKRISSPSDLQSQVNTSGQAESTVFSKKSHKTDKIQCEIKEVQDVMKNTVQKVLERDNNISDLEDTAVSLQNSASQFRKLTKEVIKTKRV